MKRAKRTSQATDTKRAKEQSQPKFMKTTGGELTDVQRLAHLLQVSQIELEHQNQELRIAEEELEASRNRYVNLFDFSPIPYFVLDLNGAIKEVNLSASKMLGIARSKLIGKLFVTYIPLDEKAVFTAYVKTVFGSPGKHSCKLRVVNKDRIVFHVQLEGVKLENLLESDQQCQIALIDLSEYKQGED